MRYVLLIVMIAGLSGCASLAERWQKVDYGQTTDQVKGIMGKPDAIMKGDSKDVSQIYAWRVNPFTQCNASFDNDGKVSEQECSTNDAARSRYQESQMTYYQNMMRNNQQMQQTNYNSMQNFQNTLMRNRPVQTNCTTNMIGGTAHSNCNSAPSGLDPGIYNH